jgi:hypothetical protein
MGVDQPARWRLGANVLATIAVVSALSACSDGRPEGNAQVPPVETGLEARGADPTSLSIIPFVEARQFNSFAVLRGDPTGLPTKIRQQLGRPILGTNEWLAQRLSEDTPRRVWVVPGNGNLCLVDQPPSGGLGTACTTTANALRHGITSTFLVEAQQGGSRGGRTIVGLAPDPAREVRVHTPGFPPVTVPVRHNVFTLSDGVTEPPETIEMVP